MSEHCSPDAIYEPVEAENKIWRGWCGVDAYNRLENEPHCLQYLYHGTIYNCTYSMENGTTLNTDLWGAMYNFFFRLSPQYEVEKTV